MDFIIGLPKSEGYGSIIVVMDMFSLFTILIVAPIDCTVGETMRPPSYAWESRQVVPMNGVTSKVEDSSCLHPSYLKPYHEDKDDPSHGISKRVPTTILTLYDRKVEYILAAQVIMR
ncbi:hypothetical protein CK203_117452 [Vitis vinifera]|uniref:Uncharacterized protein n=1 Tax=Vitis vinifera TaxID=29760 RepID=A0A438FDC7_VITVI|nr:hypothetical protein CK203_117452 [Vitis vinifera]